jgi:hypothetical protein
MSNYTKRLVALAIATLSLTVSLFLATRRNAAAEAEANAPAPPPLPGEISAAISSAAAAFGESRPVREIAAQYPAAEIRRREKAPETVNDYNRKRIRPEAKPAPPSFRDQALTPQRAAPAAPVPTPLVSFDGVPGPGTFTPPDTNGEIGPTQFVQATNGGFRVFSKTGTPLIPTTQISALFSGLPANNPCRLNNDGDPVVLYDQLADRWNISQFVADRRRHRSLFRLRFHRAGQRISRLPAPERLAGRLLHDRQPLRRQLSGRGQLRL